MNVVVVLSMTVVVAVFVRGKGGVSAEQLGLGLGGGLPSPLYWPQPSHHHQSQQLCRLCFSTKKDRSFFVKCRANISPKKRNKPTRLDLRTEYLAGMRSKSLTMRVCLGLCNIQYDLWSTSLARRSTRLIETAVGMKIVALVVNSRPVCVRYGTRGRGPDPDFLNPITPNMLLTSRCNEKVTITGQATLRAEARGGLVGAAQGEKLLIPSA